MKTNDPSRLLSQTLQFSLLTHLSLDPLKLLGKKKKSREVYGLKMWRILLCVWVSSDPIHVYMNFLSAPMTKMRKSPALVTGLGISNSTRVPGIQ